MKSRTGLKNRYSFTRGNFYCISFRAVFIVQSILNVVHLSYTFWQHICGRFQFCHWLRQKTMDVSKVGFLTNSVAPELEVSSLHSREPATSPYPEPGESTPYPPPPSQSPYGPFWSHTPIYTLVFQVVSSFELSHQNPVQISPLSHACHMPRPPHSPLFDPPNNIWWWA
jgi:hypothetical protein